MGIQIEAAPILDGETDAIAIETQNLSKCYGRTKAVSDLQMVVKKGAICGFLGPNGAGKTTTIRLLLGLSRPTSGRFLLFGREATGQPRLIASTVVALFEDSPAYPYLTGSEMLHVACLAAHQKTDRSRLLAALDRFGLGPAGERRVGTYSQGMRQRLGLAIVHILDRRIVVLDEPMNGLDPQGQADFRRHLMDLQGEGRTIVFSSHLLHDVEETCSHLVILNRGRLVAEGTTGSLLATQRQRIVARPEPIVKAVAMHYPSLTMETSEGAEVVLDCPSSIASNLAAALVVGGAEILRFEERRSSLSTLFLELTAESRKDADIAESPPR